MLMVVPTSVDADGHSDARLDPAFLEQAREQWYAALDQALKVYRLPGEIKILQNTSEASTLLREFISHTDQLVSFGGEYRRAFEHAPQNVMKIALLSCYARSLGELHVDVEDVQVAIHQYKRMLPGHLAALRAVDTVRDIETSMPFDVEVTKIVTKLKLHGSMTRRDLIRRFHRPDTEQIDRALDQCVQGGLVRLEGNQLLLADADETGGDTGRL